MTCHLWTGSRDNTFQLMPVAVSSSCVSNHLRVSAQLWRSFAAALTAESWLAGASAEPGQADRGEDAGPSAGRQQQARHQAPGQRSAYCGAAAPFRAEKPPVCPSKGRSLCPQGDWSGCWWYKGGWSYAQDSLCCVL